MIATLYTILKNSVVAHETPTPIGASFKYPARAAQELSGSAFLFPLGHISISQSPRFSIFFCGTPRTQTAN
jgi:hypothetical protein